MQQTVSLNKQEVNQAILEYAEKHGVRLDGMDATVEVMATRGDRELFATIALEPNTSSTPKPVFAQSIQEVFEDTEEDEDLPEEKVESVDADIDDEDSIFS